MAEIFAPMLDAFEECAAFVLFMAFTVACSYAFYLVLYIMFGHKSETIRVLWYGITFQKTEKRNGRTMPIRNRKSVKTAA